MLSMAKDLSIELEGLRLEPKKLSKFRILWNLKELLKKGHYSGFQYSDFFLSNLYKQVLISEEDRLSLISTYPLLPHKLLNKNWNLFFYIDATTKQIFDVYKKFKSISKKYKEEILIREKDNYNKSKIIFCFSSWAKNSLINDYEIPSQKIKVLPAGANIDPKNLNNFNVNHIPKPPSKRNPLKIGFLGQDWIRKGGPIVLEVVKILNSKSIPTILRVMGESNKKNLKNEYIQSVGFVDKNKEINYFISEIKSWHFGTLFSKAEAFGISNRECFLLGVPVLCHDIGGIRSTFPDEDTNCGSIFNPDEDPLVIANWIENIVKDYSKYIKLRTSLSQINSQFTWEDTIRQMFYEISLFEK
tara:strand:- start:250 stop:1323 length:1074 start_codon:yes stop_codon:yes gene_type:complete